MVTAVYDNPATMCREAWEDGKVIAHITANLIYMREFRGHPTMPFVLNCGSDFVPGRIFGDATAITQQGAETL